MQDPRETAGKAGAMAAIRSAVLCLMLGVMMALSGPVHAQEGATPESALPEPLTQPAIDALVSRLSDTEVRDLLLKELGSRAEAAPAAEPPKQTLIDAIVGPLRSITSEIRTAVATSPGNVAALRDATVRYVELLGPREAFRLVVVFLLAIAAGFAVDLLFANWIARRKSRRPQPAKDAPAFPGSLPLLARRLVKDAGGAVLSLIVGAVILTVLLPERETRVAMSVALGLFFFPRLAWTMLRFFLSPHVPELRLVDTDDRTAKRLVYNLVGVLVVVGAIKTVLLVMQEVGMADGAGSAGFWVNLLVFVWIAVLVIRCRNGLKQIVRGGQVPLLPGEAWLVAAYPAYAIIVIAVMWFAGMVSATHGDNEVMRNGTHLISLGILLVAPMFDALIRASVRLIVPPMRGTGPAAQKAYDASFRSYIRVARVVVFGGIVIALARLWGLTLVTLAEAGVGEHMAERFVAATLIVVVGYILLEVVSLTTNRKLATLQTQTTLGEVPEHDEGFPITGGAASRLGTILPPISWSVQAAIVLITLLTALGHLGVNVTALLAGAGVAGIAIGFGAQKLVADLVSGIFFLMDDAFRLNEYISTGKIDGNVEKIALQSMHLRQSDGALHCIPYSTVDTITNFSRDWGTTKLSFTVPFETDIERVRKIFKKIGQELAANPAYTAAILQPFKFKGVSQVNDVGIVLRGKFMFKPELGKQFEIRRDIYAKVQYEFAQAGIQFARREVRISVDTHGESLTENEMKAIGAAAAEAVPDVEAKA